jgi:hypothetical protein
MLFYYSNFSFKKIIIFIAINYAVLILSSNNFFYNFSDYLRYGSYYPTGFQGLCTDLWAKQTFKSVFFSHHQPPAYLFIVGFTIKFGPILSSVFLFLINNLAASMFYYFSYELLKFFFKKKILILLFTSFLILNPTMIYLQFLQGWEVLFLCSITFFTLCCFNIIANPNNKKNYLYLFLTLCFLFLLRSTFGIFILILLILLVSFLGNLKLFKKYIILIFAIYFVICFKNFILVNKFTLETQGILHLGWSANPSLIQNEKFYNNLYDYEKKFIKNSRPPLSFDLNAYREMGFPYKNYNIEILDRTSGCASLWNHSVMANVSTTYSKILKETIANYPSLFIINFFKVSYNNLWGEVNEYVQLWKIPKFSKFHDKIISAEIFTISIKSIVASSLILSSILLLCILIFKKNFNSKIIFLYFIPVLICIYTIFAGSISIASNFRYRFVIENYLLLYLFIFFKLYIDLRHKSSLFNYIHTKIKILYLSEIILFAFVLSHIPSNINKLVEKNNIELLKNNTIVYENKKTLTNIKETSYLNQLSLVEFNKTKFIPKERGVWFIRNSKEEIVKYTNDYSISKNLISTEEYLKFVIETKSNYPIWYNHNISFNENKLRQTQSLNNNLNSPITGISLVNATEYTNWLSFKTGKKIRIPTSIEWELFNDRNKKEVIQDTVRYFEWTLPDYKYLYVFGPYLQDYVSEEFLLKNKDKGFYLFPSENFGVLKNGSFMTFNHMHNPAWGLFIGKKLQDVDFSFRILIEK